MPEILIIADDYTGANDTAVMVRIAGCGALTILDPERFPGGEGAQAGSLSFSTDSRGIAPGEAYERVFSAVKRYAGGETALYSKRIDSTLRGNLGSETDAMLDALGDGRVAVVVPAMPQAGRVCVDGKLLVNGIDLTLTAAARDPKAPVDTSSPLELFGRQSKYPFAGLTMSEQEGGEEALAEKIRGARDAGVRGIILDAASGEDLERIAGAVLKSGVPFICVDPGAFTQVMARHMHAPKETCEAVDAEEKTHAEADSAAGKAVRETHAEADSAAGKAVRLLFVIGSVNDIAAAQARKLIASEGVDVIYMDAEDVLSTAAAGDNVPDHTHFPELSPSGAAGDASRAFHTGNRVLCLCTTGIFPERKVDFAALSARRGVSAEELSAQFNRSMALAARRILEEDRSFTGIFACGGDAAVELCRTIGAYAETPLEEVVPLAVYGRLEGGICSGYRLITKGGMVGDEDTMLLCRSFLEEKQKQEMQIL